MRALLLLPLLVASPLAASAEEGGAEAAAIERPALQPPRLIDFVEASWPAEAGAGLREARVGLVLTIDADGAVTKVEVVESAGAAFDQAAQAASLRFRFDPARRNGEPMPARIRYVYEFRLPEPVVAEPLPEPAPPEPATDVAELVVTVEGESEAEQRRNSAEAVQVIETEQAKRQTADLGEVLARQEGIRVRRTGSLGSGTEFSLNGLSGEQVRFYLDGVPLDLAGYPFGLANVPVNLVERIEVYRGVVPVRYGADALGGAVNLVTDERPEGTGGSLSLQGGAFGTWRLTAAGHHHHEPSGFLARANFFADIAENDYAVDVEDPTPTGVAIPLTADRFHDAYGAVGGAVDLGYVDLGWADRVLVRLHAAGFDKELQHDLTMQIPYGEAAWRGQSWGGQLIYEQGLSEDVRLELLVGYARQQFELDDRSNDNYLWSGEITGNPQTGGETSSRKRDQHTAQDAVLARLNLSWRLAEGHALRFSVAPTYAARSAEDELQPDPLVRAALEADRTQLNVVSGVEYEVDLFDDRLETIVFAKNYLYSASGEVVRGSDTLEVARDLVRGGYGLATRLRLAQSLQLKASYEFATRLPRPDEVFGDGALIEANLELKPETSHNINLGLAASDLATDAGSFRGGVNGFARLLDEFIVFVPKPFDSTWANAASARAWGVELAAGWSAPGGFLHVDGNFTWQDFRNTSTEGAFARYEGDRMINRPWLFGNVAARLELREVMAAEDELTPYWSTRFVNEFYRFWERNGLEATKQVVPAQVVQSTGVSYRVPADPVMLGLAVEVDNVTDADVYDFFGVQRPGRAAYFKATVEY